MRSLIRIASMFGPFAAMKFWVSVIMGIIQFVQVYTGYDFGLDQVTVTSILSAVWAILVWALPNAKPTKDTFPPAPGGLY